MTFLSSQRQEREKCRFCGTHVSEEFRYVFGDEENIAHRCPGCDSRVRLQKGSAAGRSVDWPDPAERPNRNRGSRVGVHADGGELP